VHHVYDSNWHNHWGLVNPDHKIQGGGYSMTDLVFVNPRQVDGYIQVSDDDVINAAHCLVGVEGIYSE
jgi:cysteine synthase